MDAFFFPTSDDLRLFGVARGPYDATRAWILCPPFGEEEKSSRLLFTLIAQDLAARGEASLVFSFRGTGDSEGNFEDATLGDWKLDLVAATSAAHQRFPRAGVALLGVRLGASLAWQEAQELQSIRLILIEPLVSGRSFLMQQNAKKQLRAQLTTHQPQPPSIANSPQTNALFEDLDGWALGETLKSQLGALDLKRETPHFSGTTLVFQVGPKPETTPLLQALCEAGGAKARAVVMPAFWNLIDTPDFSPLLQAIQNEIDHD